MKTAWVRMDGSDASNYIEEIEAAGQILRDGGLVAFPTETVYGLGGDALSPASSQKIYAAKGRPSDNPLIVHIAAWESLEHIAAYIPPTAAALAEAFWPGPLTMIFQKKDTVPYETTGGLDTVAVRLPQDPVARALIQAAGGYVAAPSANTSGRPSPTNGARVYEDLQGRIDMLLDTGDCQIGLESTIVDLTEDIPVILRPGFITEEMLSDVLGQVRLDPTILSVAADVAPKAPGMKYRHYAPKGDLTIVAGDTEGVLSYINERIDRAAADGRKIGVIATDETAGRYAQPASVKSAGKRTEPATIARRLYEILREFDEEGTLEMYAEAFDDTGMGQAIMNRLLKAAGHKVVSL